MGFYAGNGNFVVTLQPNFKDSMKIAYRVAEHCFVLNIDEKEEVIGQLSQYEPFKIAVSEAEHPLFELEVVDGASFMMPGEFVKEFLRTAFRKIDERDCPFRLLLTEEVVHHDAGGDGGIEGHDALFGLNNAMMVMYALSTSNKQTALFHSSVIGYQGKGYMFLGKSGTGKSTHSRLWLTHIEGTELMNDDNPVVRLIDGEPWVFGSPWSGKTPCYKNIKAPIGAIVQLSQAPYNKISRLKGLKAYAALIPSISGKRWDKQLADGLHETETMLAERAKMFHLECLPDKAAAITCMEAVTSEA